MSEDEELQYDEKSRARRARLARIFGDVLPDTGSDDRGSDGDGSPKDWFESERPPHHL